MSARFPKIDLQGVLRTLRKIILPWRSLTWQTLLLTIIPLTALVLAVAFGSLSIHQKAMRNLVGERDELAVRTAAAALEEQLNHRVLSIHNLAVMIDGDEKGTIGPVLDSVSYLIPEFDQGIMVLDSMGNLISGIGNTNYWNTAASQITQAAADLSAQQDPAPYLAVSIPVLAKNEAVILIMVVSPKRDWIAGGAFSTTEMVQHTLTNAFSSGPGTSVIIMDSDKRLLYVNGVVSFTGEFADHPGYAQALSGQSGTTYVMVGNAEHVIAYSPISPVGWTLILEEPWEMVDSPTLRTSQVAPLVLVPVLIVAMIALWFGATQIVKPLQTLETRAADLAWGDFHAIEAPVGGIEEIRHLQKELILMAHKVQTAQSSLRGYIGAITAAQEEERRRLARELHDDTIQALIALKQRVQLTRLHTPPGAPEVAALEEIAQLTEQTIENLRRLTRALRPIYLEDLGLVTALEMQARETGLVLGIPVSFQCLGSEKRIDPSLELALYRMTQEAFSNIARHASASKASLVVAFKEQEVAIEVKDDGVGFEVPHSPAEFAPGGHYGLLGLFERAELIGANLTIKSKPGQGTHLTVKLLLTSTEEQQRS